MTLSKLAVQVSKHNTYNLMENSLSSSNIKQYRI